MMDMVADTDHIKASMLVRWPQSYKLFFNLLIIITQFVKVVANLVVRKYL